MHRVTHIPDVHIAFVPVSRARTGDAPLSIVFLPFTGTEIHHGYSAISERTWFRCNNYITKGKGFVFLVKLFIPREISTVFNPNRQRWLRFSFNENFSVIPRFHSMENYYSNIYFRLLVSPQNLWYPWVCDKLIKKLMIIVAFFFSIK